MLTLVFVSRQTTQEPSENVTRYCQSKGRSKEEREVDECLEGGWGIGELVETTLCIYACSRRTSLKWRIMEMKLITRNYC